MTKNLPRNMELPLFDPHMKTFSCETEAMKVPPIDAQADAWFLEANALEAPEHFLDDPDYASIIQLNRQAADRLHWKAMLNLASLYVEGRDHKYNSGHALELVETAMRHGIPAAFDRMGTYFMNGTAVNQSATKAYAFWLRAAEMGNPQAMTFLANKIDGTWDSPKDGFWANIPIATKMLQCALGQGEGTAAFRLASLYEYPRDTAGKVAGDSTQLTRNLALNTLQEGVRLGCKKCANHLASEFDSPLELSTTVVPYPDRARSARYAVLADALNIRPNRRFPNLDKVLPLPPADLPVWNGDKTTLIHAAMGYKPPATEPKPSASAQRTGRHFLDAAFSLRKSGLTTSERRAPFGGYWLPVAHKQPPGVREQLLDIPPAEYRSGEDFRQFAIQEPGLPSQYAEAEWEHWLTVPHDDDAVRPAAARGLVRIAARPEPLRACSSSAICPLTGTWQPWVPSGHPLQTAVNQYWRQRWLRAGQPFPQPELDWQLCLPAADVTWHLMDAGMPDLLDEPGEIQRAGGNAS